MKRVFGLTISLAVSLLPFGVRAAASQSNDIELTGLVAFGSSRIACLKMGQSTQSFALHPGETASGITLRDLDVKAGWALIERGTNQYMLRLATYCAPSTTAAAAVASYKNGTVRRANPNQGTQGIAADLSAGPNPADASGPYPNANDVDWENPALFGGPSLGVLKPNALGNSTPAPAPPQVGTQSSTVAESTTAAPSSAATDATTEAPLTLQQEGERVRLFYGDQAFLAWDHAHPYRY